MPVFRQNLYDPPLLSYLPARGQRSIRSLYRSHYVPSSSSDRHSLRRSSVTTNWTAMDNSQARILDCKSSSLSSSHSGDEYNCGSYYATHTNPSFIQDEPQHKEKGRTHCNISYRVNVSAVYLGQYTVCPAC